MSDSGSVADRDVNRWKDLGLRFAACFLILWTPFFFFSAYRGHPVPVSGLLDSAARFAIPAFLIALVMGRRSDLWRSIVLALLVGVFFDLQFSWFGGAVGAGTTLLLVGLFWTLREHVLVILTVIFATTLVSTAVAPPAPAVDTTRIAPAGFAEGPKPVSPSAAQPETLVYLILDEFAGLAGIPADLEGGPALRDEVSAFFQSYGFTLFPAAYAEYPSSKHSIGTILNFEASRRPQENFRGKRPYVLLENRAFAFLNGRYSEIHVTQSNYMDFCSESKIPLASCSTYRFDSTEWLAGSSLDEGAKLDVLLGMYFNLPGFFEFAAKTYVRMRNRLLAWGIPLPRLPDWDGMVAPIAASGAFEAFTKTVVNSSRGTAHVGHLLLPHGPYVYDEECNLSQAPLAWMGPRPLHEKTNTTESRAVRYAQYFPQVRCTLAKLGAFFETLRAEGRWSSTRLILHGDHGARFYRTRLLERERAEVSEADLADGYSALFAVRHSANDSLGTAAPSRISEARPISQLLPEALGAPPREWNGPPHVFLEGEDEWFEIEWQPAIDVED